MYRKTAVLSAMTVLLLWGCVTVRELIDEPEIEFTGMSLRSVSLLEATPVFRFRLTHTNPMGINVKNIAYNLKINNKKFVKGVSAQTVRLRPAGSGELELPITFNYLDLFESVAEFRYTDTVRYDLSGIVSIGPFSLPYQTGGEFDIPTLPGVSLRAIRVTDLSFPRASLVLDMELKNANAFAVRPSSLSYVCKLEGKELLRGRIPKLPAIAESGNTRVEIPVTVDLFKLEQSVYRIVKGRSAAYEISGSMAFDAAGGGQRRFPFKAAGRVPLRH
ncbi:hypothetical protein DENIS_4678 [Desulfonema ishimotonii]|uniref:Water stress and hypersensitive response domain-containing protein n=1 Tax=Desulfonema ishimotonii TaxID=45657 RepID=A0A401G372_9BACT|nr:LEA type 2 family protein [Desulfonema ishimotonii]GBC63680.1 hypothetical protein DENIS_4678 [Desulfonema ishimotonii]